MKYLVLAIFTDFFVGGGNIATHSKVMDLGHKDPKDAAEEIIEDISKSGVGRINLFEVFVFKSAENNGSAPRQVAYWNQEDGLFGH